MMKRFLCFLLVLGFAGVTVCHGETAPWSEVLFSEAAITDIIAPETGTRFSQTNTVMQGDSAVQCMLDGSVYTWRSGDPAPQRLCQLPSFDTEALNSCLPYRAMMPDMQAELDAVAFCLIADEDTLYALYPYSGRIAEITSQGLIDIQFNSSPLFDENGLLLRPAYGVLHSRSLYLLADAWNEEPLLDVNYHILAIDLSTGKTDVLTAAGTKSMCLFKDDSLLLLRLDKQGGYYLSQLNTSDGGLTAVDLEGMPLAMSTALAWDKADDAVWLTALDGVYRSASGNRFERVAAFVSDYISELAQGWALPGGGYAFNQSGIHIFMP